MDGPAMPVQIWIKSFGPTLYYGILKFHSLAKTFVARKTKRRREIVESPHINV